MTVEGKTIDDLLKLQAEAFKQHKDQVKEVLDQMKEMMASLDQERKEFREARELQEDMVREYDRLTQRASTQLRAMIELTTRLEQLS